MRKHVVKSFKALTHVYGSISKKYYCEDFVRVYANGTRISRLGKSIPANQNDIKNLLNHQKFYAFATQFAKGTTVADIGCGSGYGCAMFKDFGATRVYGTDASKHAVRFANDHYGSMVEFSVQGITDMNLYHNNQFDLTICSEVLEHIKEYRKEDRAVEEIKRITKPSGIIIVGTPNSEVLGDHGFSFEEIEALIKKHFNEFCIFENALVPFGSSRELWEQRQAKGQTGVIVTQAINLDETVIPNGVLPLFKKGIPAGTYNIGSMEVDTTLLHNSHSWIIVAIKDQV